MVLLSVTATCRKCHGPFEAIVTIGEPVPTCARCPRCRHSGLYGFFLAPLAVLGRVAAWIYILIFGPVRKMKPPRKP